MSATMDSTKPASNPQSFLEPKLKSLCSQCLKQYDFAKSNDFASDMVAKAFAGVVTTKFREYICMALRFWGSDEIYDTLKQLPGHGSTETNWFIYFPDVEKVVR